jgi:FkbM family methyltransferase
MSAKLLRPTVRAWIRHAPVRVGKAWLWQVVAEPYFAWSPHRFVARTRFGARMGGDTAEYLQQLVYYFGVWEPNLTAWLSRRLRSEDVFVDVGANVGYFTLLASRLVGRSGGVVAVEPSPRAFAALEANLARNRAVNVRAVPVAVSARRDRLALYRGPGYHWGLASLCTAPELDSTPEAMVEAVPLAELLSPAEAAAARVVKIDAEGAEADVVEGVVPLLRDGRPDLEVVVEIGPDRLASQGRSAAELFRVFHRFGFHPYHLENDYDPTGHLPGAPTCPPRRIDAPPDVEADVVFSRVDSDRL